MDANTILRELRGAGDTAWTVAKGAALEPVAGLYGLARLLRGDSLDAAVGGIEDVQGAGGGPSTREGQRNLEGIAKAIEWAGEKSGATAAMDRLGQASPAAGAATLAALGVIDPGRLGKARRIAKATMAVDRSTGQGMLPGMEQSAAQIREQRIADRNRTMAEDTAARERASEKVEATRQRVGDRYFDPGAMYQALDDPNTRREYDIATERMRDADRVWQREGVEDAYREMDELRAGRRPDEPLDEMMDRERALLRLKSEQPIISGENLIHMRGSAADLDTPTGTSTLRLSELPEPDAAAYVARHDAIGETRRLLRALSEHDRAMTPEAPDKPQWARDLTRDPTDLRGGTRPAGPGAWQREPGLQAPIPPSVEAFLRAIRDDDAAFQYGAMPRDAYDIEDFADAFGRRTGRRIDVDYEGDSDEPYKIEREKEHGRGEVMRDRWGEYKQEEKTHDPGDFPMYDESGDVKMIEAKGPTKDPDEPLMVKRVAEGGEPVREGGRYGGSQKYRFIKSEGGEPMRDERGDIKYEEVENPDYRGGDDALYLRSGRDEIKVSDWESGEPTVYAMDAGDSGALLYQTLLAHASKAGKEIGSSGLTGDNAFRLLSNTLANYARTGTNPRNVSGTASGERQPARGFASGPEIWRAESGEADARIRNSGGDPDALRFTGEGFTDASGAPLTPEAIRTDLERFSPAVERTKVGPKSAMRSAVFKWLEQATPEQAEAAARNWGKVGGPLFGVAGMAALLNAMRDDAQQDNAD